MCLYSLDFYSLALKSSAWYHGPVQRCLNDDQSCKFSIRLVHLFHPSFLGVSGVFASSVKQKASSSGWHSVPGRGISPPPQTFGVGSVKGIGTSRRCLGLWAESGKHPSISYILGQIFQLFILQACRDILMHLDVIKSKLLS